MDCYILTKAKIEKVTLIKAMVFTKQNLRPDLKIDKNSEGYLIKIGNSFSWITEEEFEDSKDNFLIEDEDY